MQKDQQKAQIAYNFKKHVVPHLTNFEKLKDWPDFCNWLQKEYPTHLIPEKLTFAKRLAQCLNPTLPHGTHKIALQVYSRLFRNLRSGDDWLNDLPIFCIGLFPFFQNCSIQVKPEFLQIIEENFLINIEILPMIVGLVTSILPGLEEKDEGIQKKIVEILGKLQNCVGERFLVGALWIAILRTPKVRAMAIQYLTRLGKKKHLPSKEGNEAVPEIEAQTQAPTTNTSSNDTSISGGEVTMKDGLPVPKNRDSNPMDFERKETGINIPRPDLEGSDPMTIISKELYDNLKVAVNESPALGKYQVYFPKGSVVLNASLACFEDEASIKKLILDYLGAHLNLNDDVLSQKERRVLIEGAIKLFEKKDISINRRLYKWIFGGDIDNEIVINSENQNGFQLMIEALKYLFKNKPSDVQEAIQPVKIMQNIFIEHEELGPPILRQLAVSFITYYYDACAGHGSQFSEEVSNISEKLIENIAENFQIVLESFKNEIVNSNKMDKMKIMKMIKFIAQRFISKETSGNNRKSNYYRTTIMGILSQLGGINMSNLHTLDENDISLLKFGSQTLNYLIIPLVEVASPNEQVLREVCGDEEFVGNLATFIDQVAKMLKIYSKESDQVDLTDYVYILQDLMNFVIYSFEFTQVLQPLAAGEIPEWLIQTYQGINSKNQVIVDITLESCVKILEIFAKIDPENVTTFNRIWERIRDETFSPELEKKIDFYLMRRMVIICFDKLDLRETKKIIGYILLLSKYALDLIDQHVDEQLKRPNVEENIVCFRECTKFWKLTEAFKGDDIDAIRERFSYKLLPFFDHENPLMRHSAKGWLVSSIDYFYNILDVIFESMLMKTEWKFTNGEVLYLDEYPAEEVTRSIKHLKNMLIVLGNSFCEYISKTKLTPRICRLVPKVGEKKLLSGGGAQTINYLDLLAVICLRYIEGNVLESDSEAGSSFYMRNLSVKATACEFLEMIVSKFPIKSIIGHISFYLLEPLSKVLSQAVSKDQSSNLIQILSVMTVILFNSNFQQEKEFQERYIQFLQNKTFLETLIRGLASKHAYVVTEFRNFLNSMIVVTSEHMRHPALTEIVSRVLQGYYELIKNNNDRFIRIRKAPKLIGARANPAINLITSLIGEKDIEDASHGNQIDDEFLERLLDGLEFTLKTFVGSDNINEVKKVEDTGLFISIITLGMKSTPKDEIFFKNHEDVGKSILADLRSQLDAFSTCWDMDDDFMRSASFTDFGGFGYKHEEILPYVKKVKWDRLPVINQKIIKIIRPFGKRFMKILVEELLKYWISSFSDKATVEANPKLTKSIRTLLNIICDCMLNPIELLSNLNKAQIMKNIRDYNNGLRKKLTKPTPDKRTEININCAQALKESRILYFLYNYLKYMKIDYDINLEERKGQYVRIWMEALNVLKSFSESISLNTSFWIIEIIGLLSVKFNLSGLFEEVSSEVHNLFTDELSFLSSFAAKNLNIGFGELFVTGNSILAPVPPTIFEFYFNIKNQKMIYNDQKLAIIKEIVRSEFKSKEEVERKYRFQTFKVLTFAMQTNIMILSGANTAKADRLMIRIRAVLDNIFPILEIRDRDNNSLVESASEVIHECIVQNDNKVIVRQLQKDVMKVFDMGPFFRCTSNTLKYWAKIIDRTVLHSKTDVLEEYLKYLNFSSLFSSKTNEDKIKISSFERVCFIIYAGEVDRYMSKTKIKSLLEKIREVLKDENSNRSMLILIFFILRVLILRLSPSHLSELFRNIWPILLTLMIDVFERKPVAHHHKTKTEISILLAALKLLELLSICNVDEFNLYQWVFIYDYFGVSIDMVNQKRFDTELKGVAYPLKFQPYLYNTLPDGLKVDYLGSAFDKEVYQSESSKKEKRRILIIQNNLETEFELQAKAQELLTYMVLLNQTRVYVDNEDIETLIQNDFIGLSEIFNE